MRIDCHMHTPLCGHAVGEPIEYVREAAKRRMDLVTFTCHIPMNNGGFGGRNIRMHLRELDTYFAIVAEAAKFGEDHGVRVLTGIEAEIFPSEQIMREMDSVLRDHAFHFVLGSMHHHTAIFQEWMRQHKLDTDFKKIDAYFRVMTDGVRSGRYDSIAHPDVIRIYGTVNDFVPEEHEEVIKKFLEAAVEEDVCIEVNTSGLSKGVYEVHPDPKILRWARELGCKLTLGSDSHHPESVGQHFDQVLPMLQGLGFSGINYFENRKRRSVKFV